MKNQSSLLQTINAVTILIFSFENLGKRKVTVVKERVLTEEERRRNEQIKVLRQVFEQIDEDGGGTINAREMDKVLAKLNVKLSQSQLEKMMRDADLNSNIILNYQFN